MSTKVLSSARLLSLVAAISVAAGAANAADRTHPPKHHGSVEVTGAIDAHAAGNAEPSAVIGRARMALDRFTEARAAMEHGFLLRETAPKSDIAAVQADMKDVRDNLAAIEQMDPSGSGASAKKARELADDWFSAGMQIMVPPANGLTEMPLPMLVKSKAEQVATALDRLVAEATTNAVHSAATLSQPFAAAVPPAAVRAATPMRVSAHRHAVAAGPCGPTAHRAARIRLAHAKPMTESEASARLLVEGLPLFMPPAALFLQDRDPCQP
jgi:hypothetical protein